MTSLEEVVARALQAYEDGANSLFVVRGGSFHEPVAYFYAQKRVRGRVVRNPQRWLEVAYEHEQKKDAMLYALSLKGGW